MPTTFILGFNSATAFMTPRTTPEPHMSYFISSILDAGLMDIPPLSNVSPFPTNTFGFCFLGPPMYSIMMNFGGTSVPEATPAKAPMPILVNFSRSNTVTFMPPDFPIAFAFSAKWVGVATFPGRFSTSLARHTPLAMMLPFVTACLFPPTIVASFISNRSLSVVLNSLNW